MRDAPRADAIPRQRPEVKTWQKESESTRLLSIQLMNDHRTAFGAAYRVRDVETCKYLAQVLSQETRVYGPEQRRQLRESQRCINALERDA